MVIAIDTRINNIEYEEEYKSFIQQTLKKITSEHPQHTFVFIADKEIANTADIIIPVVLKNQKNNLLSQISGDYKISAVLKKYKADIFITTKCLRLSKIPQCLIVYGKPKSSCLKKAGRIITTSQFSKKSIVEKFKIHPNKIVVVYPEANEIFKSISFEEKQQIKEQYASGNEYFLLISSDSAKQNLINILKAFSVFKKRQKSNMQLLVQLSDKNAEEISEQLRLYKFKDAVKILENISSKDFAKVMAAAYSIIYLPFSEESLLPFFEIMKCEVPVLTSTSDVSSEICADAALYANVNEPKSIANRMMLVFKDEKLKTEIVDKGKQQLKRLTNNKPVEEVYLSL